MCANIQNPDDPRYSCNCHLYVTEDEIEADADARDDYEFESYRAERMNDDGKGLCDE